MSSGEDFPVGATWKAVASDGSVAVVEKLGHKRWRATAHRKDGSQRSTSIKHSKNQAREVARGALYALTDDRPIPTLRRIGGEP